LRKSFFQIEEKYFWNWYTNIAIVQAKERVVLSKHQSLNVNEVLRFANHDFMNQLQLIKMNLDLGRLEEAKKAVEQTAEQCKTFFSINKMGLPKTIDWIHTLEWRYPSIHVNVETNIDEKINQEADNVVCDYLEGAISHIYEALDPFVDQQLSLQIYASNQQFEIEFHLIGHWSQKEHYHILKHPFIMNEEISFTQNEWHMIITKKEGI